MKKMWKKNNKAVSPVIATILMVAITVVLAAVLYVRVMGFGDSGNPEAPTVSLTKTTTSTGYSVVITISPSTSAEQISIAFAGDTGVSGIADADTDGFELIQADANTISTGDAVIILSRRRVCWRHSSVGLRRWRLRSVRRKHNYVLNHFGSMKMGLSPFSSDFQQWSYCAMCSFQLIAILIKIWYNGRQFISNCYVLIISQTGKIDNSRHIDHSMLGAFLSNYSL